MIIWASDFAVCEQQKCRLAFASAQSDHCLCYSKTSVKRPLSKRSKIGLLNLSSWCLLMDERLVLAVPRGCLQFVIVVFPDHTHLLFFKTNC